MPLSPNTLKSIVGDLLAHATEFVEVTESLPRRHMDRDRSMSFEVTQVAVPGLDEDEMSQLVGSFVATNPEPDLAALETLASRLGEHGDLQLAIDAATTAMRALGMYLSAYSFRRLAGASMREFGHTLGVLCADVHTALARADRALEQEYSPDPASFSCTQIDGRPHVSLAQVARRRRIKEDSVRRELGRKKVAVIRRGDNHYVALEDLPGG